MSETTANAQATAEAGTARKLPKISFEFFPPKTEEMERSLWETIRRLEPLEPGVRLGHLWRRRLDPRAHPRDRRPHPEGDPAHAGRAPDLRRRLARRGRRDRRRTIGTSASATSWRCAAIPPTGIGATYQPHPDGYQTSAELVAGIRKRIATSRFRCRPIRRSIRRAASFDADIDMLKAKIDAGATRAITQFFFDNDTLPALRRPRPRPRHRHPDRARHHAGEQLQGPAQHGDALRRQRAGLARRNVRGPGRRPRDAPADRRDRGRGPCAKLAQAGLRHFHFYTLNRADLVFAICHLLGFRANGAQKAA